MIAKTASLIFLIAFTWAAIAAADSVPQRSITIIIDDVGNNYALGARAVNLPGPVTFAVLPHSPYGQKLAELAFNRGKEVMLHMPMDNDQGRPLGPGGLTAQQSQTAFSNYLEQAIAWVPHIQGVNNHMGSSLTQSSQHMQWVMNSLRRYPLYFVDSRTSADSVAESVAVRNAIPTLRRDVFLDHDPDPQAINIQFKRLLNLAYQNGNAVAIGHPYPSTLGYLETVLPKLDAFGIKVVTPSGMLELRNERPIITAEKPSPSVAANPDSRRCELAQELHVTRVTCG